MCPAAARLHDPIAHTSTLGMFAKMAGSLIVGAIVGAVATMAVVALVASGPVGWVAMLAIGFAVSAVMEATGVNAFIDRVVNDVVDALIPPSIEGKITSGSSDVTINSLPAARAASPNAVDVIVCAKHGGAPPMIAQGSDNVYFDSQPAARKGDKTTCGGTIAEGSANVFVGGGTLTVRDIKDERPWWLAALGVAIGVALTLCGKGKMNFSALKASAPCLLNIAASIGGTMAGHAIRTTMGNPVNVITGGKVLREEPDFILPGPLAIEWGRFYSSHDRRTQGLLGVGWSIYNEVQLTIERDGLGQVSALTYCDDMGRSMTFPPVLPGESHYSTAEGYYLICTELGQYLVESIDGLFRDFGVPDASYAGVLKLQRLEDRNGNWQAFRYLDDGRLGQINDGCGRALEIAYDALHPARVAEVRLVKGAEGEPLETLVQYRYSAFGELAEVIDRTGQSRRGFAYRGGLMTEHSVPGGLRCQYEWTGTGAGARVIKHWTDDGEAYSFSYDLVRRETTVVDQIDRVYHWVWSEDKQPVIYTDPEGHPWRYEWDENRQLVSMTDPLGAVTRCEYDELGRLTTTINALDQIEKTEWHPRMNLPAAETDAAGNRWSYTYDDRGNLIVVTDPEGYETEQFYDSRGLPHTIRDARGGYKHMEWNLRALMSAYVDCSARRTTLAYDARGVLTHLTDAMGHQTGYTVDVQGQVTAIVRPDGSTEKFEYDKFGRLHENIDSAGRTTRYHRNSRGYLIERVNPSGRSVKLVYDRALRLERLINENGDAYSFTYDGNDNVRTETGLDGTVKQIDYDACGLPVAVIDAVGDPDAIALHMQRDALGRLSTKHARGRSTQYRYDQISQLLQAQQYTDNGGPRYVHDNLTFTYSARGELLSETGHMGKLQHRYDEIGNRIATCLPDGRTINSLYYGDGHLHQVNIDGLPISDFERDGLHREVTRTQGKLTTSTAYDRLGRKTHMQAAQGMSHEPVLRKEWIYDRAGEVATKRHSIHGVTTYMYDPMGHVHTAVNAIHREIFAWDAAANLIDSPQKGGYVKNNKLMVFEDKRFEYDVHGRLELKRIGTHTQQHFAYDGEHRLIQIETLRNGSKQLTYFEYDALGRRIVAHDAFGSTRFLWDGLQMLQEQRGHHVVSYLYEPESYAPLARIDSKQAQGEADNVLERAPETDQAKSASVYYFHNDISGMPEELTSPTGRLVWQAQYKVLGNCITEAWHQIEGERQETQPLPQNLRFQGQYMDRESGLHYNTFRFYDPDIGRFISPDPVSLYGGTNLYNYAANPLSWSDPLGWACIPNKVAGTARETRVQGKLEGFFGKKNVLRERTLRDASGKKVVGPDGTGRRIDFIVLGKDGKPKYAVEVTSKTADKTAQVAKEAIIRKNGGVYIRDPKTKTLHDISGIPTRTIRLD